MSSDTLTFLFTDIEGSTRRWEHYPKAMQSALARHDAILREAIESQGGQVFKTVGDAFYAVFSTAAEALLTAILAQHALAAETWSEEIGELRVRMALHTGVVEARDGDFFGQPLNRVARLLSAGHGGQILLSLATVELVRDYLPQGVSLHEIGTHRLKDLFRPETIFQVNSPDLPSEFPSLKTLDSHPNNLPAQLVPLIGREREIEAVKNKVAEARLITLTGTGGTGKTRLSLQVAAEMLDEFGNGVYFVALAPLTDSTLVTSSIASVLHVSENPNEPLIETLKSALRDQHLLLVLDNFEHVMDAAPIIPDLLTAAPNLKILVTSREALRLYGEQEYPVPPLALPDLKRQEPLTIISQYEAVRLFIQRAQAIRPDFHISDENAPAVAEICVRLDGLPLAIELAAARIKLFSPEQLLGRLDNRLRTLTGGARDLPTRQQTLRDAIAWSYDLLDENEKIVFARLGIFRGGWTLEAAEAVCGEAALDGLESLVNKSLVRRTEDDEPRFTMLETIREYALERLQAGSDEATARQAHADYFLMLVERAEPELNRANQIYWHNYLETEYENIRSALQWYDELPEGAESQLRIVGALLLFWFNRTYITEGDIQYKAAFRRDGDHLPPTVRAKALNSAGGILHLQSHHQRSAEWHSEALAIYRELGDKSNIAVTLSWLSVEIANVRNIEDAIAACEEGMALAHEIGDKSLIPSLAINLGIWLSAIDNNRERGRRVFEEGLSIARELHDISTMSYLVGLMGIDAFERKDFGQSKLLLQESLELAQLLGDRRLMAWSWGRLAHVVDRLGDTNEALALFQQALSLARDVHDLLTITATLVDLSYFTRKYKDDYEEARKYLLEAYSVFHGKDDFGVLKLLVFQVACLYTALGQFEVAVPLLSAVANIKVEGPQVHDDYDLAIATLHQHLDDKTFEAAWAKGEAMSIEEAIDISKKLISQPIE